MGLMRGVGQVGIGVALGAAQVGCAEEAWLQHEDIAVAHDALTSSTDGTLTEKVARLRRWTGSTWSNNCSAVFLNDVNAGATWVMTAGHCVDPDQTYNVLSSVLFNPTRDVEVFYPHPLSDWYLGDLGGLGKVDIALGRLATPVTVSDGAGVVMVSSWSATTNVVNESAMKNAVWSFNYDPGTATPSSNWEHRFNLSGIPGEGGDSGSPIFRSTMSGDNFVLMGIRANTGQTDGATDAVAFRSWALDIMNCGGFDSSNPDTAFCSAACPCGPGEGDCDSNSECQSGLVCAANAGSMVGLPSTYDICLKSTTAWSNSSGYCGSVSGGCSLYEGDCDTHSQCKGDLVCTANIGYAIGANPEVDVCELPRMPHVAKLQADRLSPDCNSPLDAEGRCPRPPGAENRCTAANPCGLGDGDCDHTDHSTCRGYLRCMPNVGEHFGFADTPGLAGTDVDVCVHPDVY